MARSPEHDTQVAYFSWARLHQRARRAYAIPNGGKRNLITAARLKAEGVRAGVLDVCLPIAVGESHGLYIEFKAGSNNLSTEQAQEVADLVDDGYTVLVCWDAEMAIKFTLEYLRGEAPVGVTLLKPRKAVARSSR